MGLPTTRLNYGVITGLVVGASQVTLMARILGQLGTPITQATVATIAWQVSNLTQGTVVGNGSFVVANTVFNALVQADPRWIRDSVYTPGPDGAYGYNFAAVLPASTFAPSTLGPGQNLQPPDVLRCDVNFGMADGSNFRVPYTWKSTPVYA